MQVSQPIIKNKTIRFLISKLNLVIYLFGSKLNKKFNTIKVSIKSIFFFNFQRFFGPNRLGAGANKHLGTPTFIQLYKLLSVFCVLQSMGIVQFINLINHQINFKVFIIIKVNLL